MLEAVEEEIARANTLKAVSMRDQEKMEQESKQLRQTLLKMTSSSMEPEEDQQFGGQKQSTKKGLDVYCYQLKEIEVAFSRN